MFETFAALAEPNRFRIVELLRTGPRAVNDIGERLHLNQPQVSKHLRVLKEAGLVDVQARAQQRLYELRAKPLRELTTGGSSATGVSGTNVSMNWISSSTSSRRGRSPMATGRGNEAAASTSDTTVERRSDRELVVFGTFNGPARIVFDAWTKPELLKRWWAPKSLGVTLFSCESDLRVGGGYRFVFGRDPKQAMAFSGTYTEVTPPTRLVWTQLFEPMRSTGEAIVTATFDEQDGKTRLVVHQLYASKESLDGAIASGMERGMRETYEQLEELVATFR